MNPATDHVDVVVLQADRDGVDLQHIPREVFGRVFDKRDERFALVCGGVFIDENDGLHTTRLHGKHAVVTQCALGLHDQSGSQSVKFDVVPRTLVDLPGH